MAGAKSQWTLTGRNKSHAPMCVGRPLSGPERSPIAAVYAVASASSGANAVEQVLRVADPSALYVALVAWDSAAGDLSCPTAHVRSRRLAPLRILVGAFDGEGFLAADIT